MARLTKAIREEVLKRLLRHRFGDELELLGEEASALAEAVYNDVITKKQRDIMATLPEKFFAKGQSIKIQVAGQVMVVFLDSQLSKHRDLLKDDSKFSKGVAKIMPYYMSQCLGVTKAYQAETRIAKQVTAFRQKRKELFEQIRDSKITANGVLKQYTVDTKLIESWPEIEPLVRGAMPKPEEKLLPAIRLDLLNKEFGLPAEGV